MAPSKRIQQIFSTKLVDEFKDWTEECDDCMGLGTGAHGKCPYCNGTGSVLTDVGELVRYILDNCPPDLRKTGT